MSMSDSQYTNLSKGWERNKGWDVFEAGDIEELQQLIGGYGAAAERTIDSVLHNEGAKEIRKSIARILPSSGRNWAGKPRPARSAMRKSFSQDNAMLSVTIAARSK